MASAAVSVTSQRKDTVEHVADYALAGIREYWIVDARHDDIVFRILVLGANGTYADATTDTDGWIRSPLWQRGFRIRRFLDRAGLVDFELDIRA